MTARFTLLALLLSPAASAAHGLGIEVKLQGDRMVVEVFHDDDSPAIGASVTLVENHAPSGGDHRRVIGLKTSDRAGRCTFDIPPAGRYGIVADAGDGHRAETELTIGPDEIRTSTIVIAGPGREHFTGARKWLRAGLGLVCLAFAYVVWAWRKSQVPAIPKASGAA